MMHDHLTIVKALYVFWPCISLWILALLIFGYNLYAFANFEIVGNVRLGRMFVGIVLVNSHEIIICPLRSPMDLKACVIY